MLSLRRIVDAGFSIILNDKIFRVFNKENNKTIFEGKYEKPNWVVRFELGKITEEGNTEVNEFDDYSCTAFIANNNESLEQSQTNNFEKLLNSEGDNSEKIEKRNSYESEIGRENQKELIGENNKIETDSEEIRVQNDDSILSYKLINYRAKLYLNGCKNRHLVGTI